MHTGQFIGYLQDPAQLGADTVDACRSLTEAFPYCQSARLLYAKNLHAVNSLDYHRELHVAAAYAANRELLYHLIMQPGLSEKIDALEATVSDPQEDQEVQPTEVADTAADQGTADIQETPEAPQEVVGEHPPAPSQPYKDALESEILKEAISASVALGALEEELPAPEAGEISGAATPETPAAAEADEPTPAVAANETHTFSDWLSLLDPQHSAPDTDSEPAPVDTTQESLIDRFIQEEPQLTPARTEFFSPTNVAKLSIVDQDEFVTETLANIYARQGHHKKALRAFEVLRLKFPEKSAYFAGRIRELKEQGNPPK
ncbi:MAG: hypothetical protein AAGB22_06080 [Bacteroidota bacterium]